MSYEQTDVSLGQAFELGDRVNLPGARGEEAIVVGHREDGWLDVVVVGRRDVSVYSPRNVWKAPVVDAERDRLLDKMSEDREYMKRIIWELDNIGEWIRDHLYDGSSEERM